jgi:4-hydroxythreonine-4-phosphate dehydrogenase
MLERWVPRIALSLGEPAGIGPDVAVRVCQRGHPAELVVFADADMFSERAQSLGLALELQPFDPDTPARVHGPGRAKVASVPARVPVVAGRLDPRNAPYVLQALELGVRGCLRGVLDAMVTGPIHKGVINRSGVPFTGHTEFLASLTGSPQPVMMLVTPGLRVALVTTHLPLREVPDAITRPRLERILRVMCRDLSVRFRIRDPRILVLGLNPHAGEGGHLGREEAEVIEPVLQRLRAEGMSLAGPVPADTAFTTDRLAQADAVLAMYHDQGLPVLKARGFGRSVNVTLGLPIVRTSVDHGTALELAGRGTADASSLERALDLAIELATQSR